MVGGDVPNGQSFHVVRQFRFVSCVAVGNVVGEAGETLRTYHHWSENIDQATLHTD